MHFIRPSDLRPGALPSEGEGPEGGLSALLLSEVLKIKRPVQHSNRMQSTSSSRAPSRPPFRSNLAAGCEVCILDVPTLYALEVRVMKQEPVVPRPHA